MGKTKPLSIKNGRMKKKEVIMACCLVADIVDIKSPIPKVLSKNKQVAKNNSKILPFKGISNQ